MLLTVAILQTSAMPTLSLVGVVPDLMLLVVVSWSLLRHAREGIAWAIGGGLMLDLLSGGPFGATIVSLILSSVVTSLGGLNILHGYLWLPLTAILATAIYDLAYIVILQVSGHPMPWTLSLLQVVLLSMIWNGLVIYPVYWAMRWLHQRTS